MNLEEILKKCQEILNNETGLYHGWYNLTLSKYGTHVAWAVMNPPEGAPLELNRTLSSHHYGETASEAALNLMEELKSWNEQGRPFKTEGASQLWIAHDPCPQCNGTGKR